jgi:hypothetical protein
MPLSQKAGEKSEKLGSSYQDLSEFVGLTCDDP